MFCQKIFCIKNIFYLKSVQYIKLWGVDIQWDSNCHFISQKDLVLEKNPHNCFQTVLFMDTKLWQKQAFFYSFLRSKKFLRILKKVNLNQLPSNFERICELMNQHKSKNVHKAHRLKKLRWNNAIDIFSIWYKEERIGIWVFIWVFYHNGKQKGNWKQ